MYAAPREKKQNLLQVKKTRGNRNMLEKTCKWSQLVRCIIVSKKILCYILCAFAGFFYLLLFSFSCSAFRVTIHVLKFDLSNVCMKTYK